jgi:hypothetical protein
MVDIREYFRCKFGATLIGVHENIDFGMLAKEHIFEVYSLL